MTPEQTNKLQQYKKLLLKWNEKINLIGKSTEAELEKRHIQDSLQIVDLVKDKLLNSENIIVDFGSGAGLPAMVLAIMLEDLKNTKIIMCESNSKKCGFLINTIAELGLKNISIQNTRIEEIKNIKADVITARAFAELKIIFELSTNFIKPATQFVLHKGENLEKELFEASKNWEYKHTQINSTTSLGKILVAENLKNKNSVLVPSPLVGEG
jgi:16S rRNA (guanine527-N7)-methyltransferase